jgi:peroxiredoxin
MNNRARFTSTVVVGDKFKEVFNDIVKIPIYNNCGKIVSTKSSKFMYVCLDIEPRGYVDVTWDSVDGKNAIYVIIDGNTKFVKEMMLVINDVLSKHGFSIIDGDYNLVWL